MIGAGYGSSAFSAGADPDVRSGRPRAPGMAAQHGHVACVAAFAARCDGAQILTAAGADAERAGRLVVATDAAVALGADTLDAKGLRTSEAVRARSRPANCRGRPVRSRTFPDVAQAAGRGTRLCYDAATRATAPGPIDYRGGVNHADHGIERRTPLMACAARGDTQLASAFSDGPLRRGCRGWKGARRYTSGGGLGRRADPVGRRQREAWPIYY